MYTSCIHRERDKYDIERRQHVFYGLEKLMVHNANPPKPFLSFDNHTIVYLRTRIAHNEPRERKREREAKRCGEREKEITNKQPV